MLKLSAGNLCPECGQGRLFRRHRKTWMRWLPKSKLYRCNYCSADFLTAFNRTFRLGPRVYGENVVSG